MDPNTCKVTILLEFPGEPMRSATANIDLRSSGFSPLPRGRELPWALMTDRGVAREQERRRKHTVRAVVAQFAEKLEPVLMKLVEGQDTVNGYTPEQWNEMHEPTKR